MLPGKKYKPEDILKILRQRYWLVLVPWVVVAAATAAVARKLPDLYRSTALIQVVPPQVPDSIVRSVSNGRFEDRLQATQQTILSRTRLERVIQEFNLYQDERKTQIMEEVVANMRNDIKVDPVKGDAFKVSYIGRSPVTVMKVTERLAAYFKDESQVEGERRAEGTNSFVEAQVEEAHRKLVAVEDKLKQYRMSHAGELPTQQGANMQAIQTINQALARIAQTISADTNTKETLERQIALAETTGDMGTPLPDAVANGSAVQRLAAAKAALANEQLKGTGSGNPIIKQLNSLIAQLQEEVKTEEMHTPVSTGGTLSPAQKARELQLTQWRTDLVRVNKNIASSQAEEKTLRSQATVYQARNDNIPTRENELLELTREYDVLTGIYKDFVGKREASSASVNLERRQIGEQFNLLDQARLPEKPFSPDRTYINMFGVFGGLAFGLALVALIEYRDSTFKADHEVASVLSLPVLAVVPLMRSDAERRAEFRKRLLLNCGLGSTVLAGLAVLAYAFVR